MSGYHLEQITTTSFSVLSSPLLTSDLTVDAAKCQNVASLDKKALKHKREVNNIGIFKYLCNEGR
jgi:hypothetical protein